MTLRAQRALSTYMWALLAFLFLPVLIVVLFSFHSNASLGFPLEGLSLEWYESVLNSDQFRQAAWNSARVSVITGVVVVAAGTPAALALARHRFRGEGALRTLFLAPNALPFLFVGIALLTFFVGIGLTLSLWTVTIGHIVVTLPVFFLVLMVRLSRFDFSLEEAARDLGAGPWQTFRRVTLPLITPSVIAGLLLVFAVSWDELFITLFTTGTDITLPVLIWTQVRTVIDPSINAIATLLMATTLVLVIIARTLSADVGR